MAFRTAQSLLKPCWVARRIVQGEGANAVEVFSKPDTKPRKVSLKVMSSFVDRQMLGLNYTSYRRITVPIEDAPNWSLRDAVWVDVKPPAEYDKLARTADYLVHDIIPGDFVMQVIIRKQASQDPQAVV